MAVSWRSKWRETLDALRKFEASPLTDLGGVDAVLRSLLQASLEEDNRYQIVPWRIPKPRVRESDCLKRSLPNHYSALLNLMQLLWTVIIIPLKALSSSRYKVVHFAAEIATKTLNVSILCV